MKRLLLLVLAVLFVLSACSGNGSATSDSSSDITSTVSNGATTTTEPADTSSAGSETVSPDVGAKLIYRFDQTDIFRSIYSHGSGFDYRLDTVKKTLCLTFEKSTDPIMVLSFPLGAVDLELYSYVKIGFRAACNGNAMEFFYSTDDSPEISGDKHVKGEFVNNQYNELVWDMSSDPSWTSGLDLMRLDPTNSSVAGDNMWIDYIGFFETKEGADAYQVTDAAQTISPNAPSDNPPSTEPDVPDRPDDAPENVVLRFDSKDKVSGFVDHGSGMTIGFDENKKMLRIDYENHNDPLFVWYPKSGTVNVSWYPIIKLKFQANCEASGMQIFYATSVAPSMTGDHTKSASFESGMWNEVIIDLTAQQDWAGDLTILRFDPVTFSNQGESTLLEYVGFFPTVEAAQAYEPLTDEQKEENKIVANDGLELDPVPMAKPFTDLDSFNVLFIGNSYSIDTATYLPQIAKSYGMKNVYVGVAGRPGCTVTMHCESIRNNAANYEYYVTTDGNFTATSGHTLKACLTERKWDLIVINAESSTYALNQEYTDLQELLNFVKTNKTNSKAKIVWLMTWADQQDAERQVLDLYYGGKQNKMYVMGLNTTIRHVVGNKDVDMVVPLGTAFQNLRTSFLGDNLTRDGYHAGLTTGRYTLALTFYSAVTGADATACTYYLSEDVTKGSETYRAVTDAVKKAIASPYQISDSAFPHPKNEPFGKMDSFNVLFIGNSYSQDTATYLYRVAESYGQKNINIAIAGRPGCSIDMHLSSIKDTLANYEYHVFQGDDVTSTMNQTLISCLKACDWDIIVLNHGGGLYGVPAAYRNFNQLVDFVQKNKTNPDGKIVFLTSWADEDDRRGILSQYYKGEQMMMYTETINAAITCVAHCEGMSLLLPTATTMQNLRTSFLGNTITRDGYHASLTTGRYALALTFYCAITGANPADCNYFLSKDVTKGSRIFEAVVEAVTNALDVQFSVTPSQLT